MCGVVLYIVHAFKILLKTVYYVVPSHFGSYARTVLKEHLPPYLAGFDTFVTHIL